MYLYGRKLKLHYLKVGKYTLHQKNSFFVYDEFTQIKIKVRTLNFIRLDFQVQITFPKA